MFFALCDESPCPPQSLSLFYVELQFFFTAGMPPVFYCQPAPLPYLFGTRQLLPFLFFFAMYRGQLHVQPPSSGSSSTLKWQ